MLFADTGLIAGLAGGAIGLIGALAAALAARAKTESDTRINELKAAAENARQKAETAKIEAETEVVKFKVVTDQLGTILDRVKKEHEDDRRGIAELYKDHTQCMQERAGLLERVSHLEGRNAVLEARVKHLEQMAGGPK
jgi:gas vesicle protein